MYLGDLGQQCTPGQTFTVRSQRGERPNCPPGSQLQSRHGFGIRESATCYRPGVCPEPARTTTTISPQITTQVPTAVSTQVSPQISPTLAQQQASPGAGVTSAPVGAPGPVSARPTTGITGEDLERILAAQRAAEEAEREARERKQAAELEEMRRQMAERERASQEIYQAERQAAEDRAAADRFAREEAERAAREAAAAPEPGATYGPSGAPMMPPPPPSVSMDLRAPIAPEARDVTVTADAADAGPPWALILLAAGGVAALAFMGAKGKRKSRAKK